jgi:four helix bundle protein
VRTSQAAGVHNPQRTRPFWRKNVRFDLAPSLLIWGMSGVRRFTQLRAWQACVTYKKAVYAICGVWPVATNLKKRAHLEDSVAGPPAHVAEGYGRFNPADFARFVVMARSSLMESQSHVMDLDAKYIMEAKRQELDALAQVALQEVTGLLEYLQSPEALRNARRARERRIASRKERHSRRAAEKPQGANAEPRTSNIEPNLNVNTN